MTQIYVSRGIPYDLSKQVAIALTEHDVIRAHARDELNIDLDALANPTQAAIVSALCFSVGAAIPLLSSIFLNDHIARLIAVLVSTTSGLILFGFLGAYLGGANLLRGSLRVVVGGLIALGVTYGIGRAFGA